MNFLKRIMIFLVFLGVLSCSSEHKQAPVNALDINSGDAEQLANNLYQTKSSTFRTAIKNNASDSLHVFFDYLGPTVQIATLGSGLIRFQFGIYLRAQNQCNLLYVMLHIDTPNSIEVERKSNPGMSTHEECANNGYTTLKPSLTHALPHDITAGNGVDFDTQIDSNVLSVFIDGTLVWQGDIPEDTAGENTSAGIRSDNVNIAFILL